MVRDKAGCWACACSCHADDGDASLVLLGGGAIAAEALEAAAAVALKAFCKWEDIPRGKKEDRRAGGTPAPGPPGDAGVELEVLGGPE